MLHWRVQCASAYNLCTFAHPQNATRSLRHISVVQVYMRAIVVCFRRSACETKCVPDRSVSGGCAWFFFLNDNEGCVENCSLG